MTTRYRISETPLIHNNLSFSSYCDINDYIQNLQNKKEYSYYSDLLYIDRCVGELPDLNPFVNARRIFITNCILTNSRDVRKIPDWIESLSIEFTEINRLPELPDNLMRLYISRTSISQLPDKFPSKLRELIVEKSTNINRLPILPPKLNKLICVNTSIRELPSLPSTLYTLYCWSNALVKLPEIPSNLMYLRCSGNPFTEMPWIHELHYNQRIDARTSYIKISPNAIRIVNRFREMYYAIKFCEKFKQWLWRRREREARELLDPVRLAEFVENVPPEKLESALDRFFARR